MPFANEHSARIEDPKNFTSFARKQLAPGVSAVLGIREGKSTVQSLRFAKSKFTPSEAREWIKSHGMTAIAFEPATGSSARAQEGGVLINLAEFKEEPDPEHPGFFRIKDVPIVNFGPKHDGKVVIDDKMGTSFLSTFESEKSEDGHRPTIFIGHNEVGKPEKPAEGLMDSMTVRERLTKAGNKVKSVFVNFVRLTADMVKNFKDGKFPGRSIEFLRSGKIRGLALLGSSSPHDKLPPLLLSADGQEVFQCAFEGDPEYAGDSQVAFRHDATFTADPDKSGRLFGVPQETDEMELTKELLAEKSEKIEKLE